MLYIELHWIQSLHCKCDYCDKMVQWSEDTAMELHLPAQINMQTAILEGLLCLRDHP